MIRVVIFALVLLAPGLSFANSTDFLAQFKSNYEALDHTLDRSGEIAVIDSFTYRKDVALYQFGHGTMLLQRPVNGRPTVAIFVGRGHAHIDVPIAAERMAYDMLAHDTVVDDSFSICFMRIGDDFDLKIKSAYPFAQGDMSIADIGHVRDAQLEYYFKPTLAHWSDNQLQLLISTYERKPDGYFWAGFGHTYFRFDPNAPEEVQVSHMREPEFTLNNAGPQFQRQESNHYEGSALSSMNYPVRVLEQRADVCLGGSDGWKIDTAAMGNTLEVLRDSLRFVPIYLDPHLEPDSVVCNGARVDFFRRRDFFHMVLLLPAYVHRSDSLKVTMWFHNAGEEYSYLQPFEMGYSMPLNYTKLTYPKGYNYVLPGRGPAVAVGEKYERIESGPVKAYSLQFRALPTGFDTSVVEVDSGMSLSFITTIWKQWVSKEEYQDETTKACRYFLETFGMPPGQRQWYVFVNGQGASYGILRIPMYKADEKLGGFPAVAGQAVARAWVEPSMQVASYREAWIEPSVAQYMGILYAQKVAGSSAMYTDLYNRQHDLESIIDDKKDLPIAVGTRGTAADIVDKGTWMLHMLRVLMFDLGKLSDEKFNVFLKELLARSRDHAITNAEFCQLAESHVGTQLDWFFEPWLYGRNMPKFSGSYTFEKTNSQYWVVMNLQTTQVPPEDVYPVMIRVNVEGGSALLRQAISGSQTSYRIGPFDQRPSGIVFNEYSSVLCQSDIKLK
jgi:hypothetical protein